MDIECGIAQSKEGSNSVKMGGLLRIGDVAANTIADVGTLDTNAHAHSTLKAKQPVRLKRLRGCKIYPSSVTLLLQKGQQQYSKYCDR